MKGTNVDFLVIDFGSIIILNAVSDNAKQWADDHLPEDRQRWGSHGAVIEPRYFADIANGIVDDSLTISA